MKPLGHSKEQMTRVCWHALDPNWGRRLEAERGLEGNTGERTGEKGEERGGEGKVEQVAEGETKAGPKARWERLAVLLSKGGGGGEPAPAGSELRLGPAHCLLAQIKFYWHTTPLFICMLPLAT
jgi:hypothetical protein